MLEAFLATDVLTVAQLLVRLFCTILIPIQIFKFFQEEPVAALYRVMANLSCQCGRPSTNITLDKAVEANYRLAMTRRKNNLAGHALHCGQLVVHLGKGRPPELYFTLWWVILELVPCLWVHGFRVYYLGVSTFGLSHSRVINLCIGHLRVTSLSGHVT